MSDIIRIYEDDLGLLKDIIETSGRVVVLFTAPSWCRPCQQFAPHFERAAGEVDGADFVYVDIDKVTDAAVEFGVRTVPTVMLYEDGKYVRNIVAPQGAIPFIKDIQS